MTGGGGSFDSPLINTLGDAYKVLFLRPSFLSLETRLGTPSCGVFDLLTARPVQFVQVGTDIVFEEVGVNPAIDTFLAPGQSYVRRPLPPPRPRGLFSSTRRAFY